MPSQLLQIKNNLTPKSLISNKKKIKKTKKKTKQNKTKVKVGRGGSGLGGAGSGSWVGRRGSGDQGWRRVLEAEAGGGGRSSGFGSRREAEFGVRFGLTLLFENVPVKPKSNNKVVNTEDKSLESMKVRDLLAFVNSKYSQQLSLNRKQFSQLAKKI